MIRMITLAQANPVITPTIMCLHLHGEVPTHSLLRANKNNKENTVRLKAPLTVLSTWLAKVQGGTQ